VFAAVRLLLNDEPVAWDTSLTGDELYLPLEGGFHISRGSHTVFSIDCDVKNDAVMGNYRISFDDSTHFDILDKNLSTRIYPTLVAASYPLTTAELSLADGDLKNSFTNYPNPFIPSRGEVTTFAYILAEDAYVDLEIFSSTGIAVKQVMMGEYRPKGTHQDATWNGFNQAGRQVAPGVYFGRITAEYGSGRVESFKRRVALIR
jgi:hypothetical protein